jgi:hypothetical protein
MGAEDGADKTGTMAVVETYDEWTLREERGDGESRQCFE